MASASALRPQRPGAAAPCWPQTQHCKCRQKAHRQQGLHERRRGERRRQMRLTKKGRPTSAFLGGGECKDGGRQHQGRISHPLQPGPPDRGDVRLTRDYTRETSNEWMNDPNGRPTEGDTVPFQVSAREVEKAIRSFPTGSASGPDRLRPQHLLDLINNRESAGTLLQVTTDFINVLLRGECPRELRELIFGGTLIALSKKTGGLRPIV